MTPLFEAILAHCPAPDVDVDGPLQLQISQLDYSNYVGSIGIGRTRRGTLRRAMPVAVIDRQGEVRQERIGQVFGFMGLERVEVEERAKLRRVADRLTGITVETAVRFGDPATQIIDEAETIGADLIALATHHRSGLARMLKGSVAERVERGTPVPVVLVPYGEPEAALA